MGAGNEICKCNTLQEPEAPQQQSYEDIPHVQGLNPTGKNQRLLALH